jgi:hypothetical protein
VSVPLRALFPAFALVTLATGAAAQDDPDAYACTSTAICEALAPCRTDDRPLRLLIAREGALLTGDAGQEIGFDRPVTRTERGPVTAFGAVTLLDTTLLLTFDRDAGTLIFTEHARDADGPRAVTVIATCRAEDG